MKKSLLALAALSAVAGAASAQVTLSGGVDQGVASVDGEKIVQTAGKSARSNLTFSGKEDLGDGMSVGFVLNHRFNPQNGTINGGGNGTAAEKANQIFRNSFIDLNTKAGSVRLGRYLSPLQELNGSYDAFGTDTVGSVHVGGLAANVRINSAVEYRSPTFAGIQLLLATTDSKAQGIQGQPRTRPMGVAVTFNQGPISLGVATDKTSGDTAANSNVDSLKTLGVYGKFTMPNKAAVMFQYEKGDTQKAGNAGATPAVVKGPIFTTKGYSLSAKMPVGMSDIKIGYMKKTPDVGNDEKKFGLGVDYNLSKRTQLYVDMGKRSGNSLSDANKKTMWDLGIYHKF
jgi:predicted porin